MDGASGSASSPVATRGEVARPGESALAGWTRALAATADIDAHPHRTLPVLLDQVAAEHGDRPALLSDGERYTYAALAARKHGYASWAREAGLKRGDVVALLMENRPDYVAIWLGLTQAGLVVALLNTNLAGAALAHCVDAAKPVRIVVSAPLAEAWRTVTPYLGHDVELWTWGYKEEGAPRLDDAIEASGPAPVGGTETAPTLSDPALYIYTSGTTGLPKAAVVSHRRVVSWALWFAGMLDTGPDDRMYDCLPLYHSVGGVVAVGALLARGGSVVVAPSFSASRFWDDVRRWDCTLFQYIGELCRYLLASPPRADERAHRLRLVCGNGLRGDIWDAFKDRFAIPRIVEFYAASEGTFSLYNLEGEPGAIGRIPAFLAHRFPAAIVRFDADRQAPYRDEQGRCQRVARGEAGEAIGRVSVRDPAHRFEGYTDEGSTEAKILRDVFAEGDAWARTGDLMRVDARGFWRFVDRVGDTFRWKGENVSALEVATTLMRCPGVGDATVFGVAVPGADGRAGMAVLTPSDSFDLARLAAHMRAELPAYARPIFLRLSAALEKTGTFKHRNADLVRAGFDPGASDDPLFVLSAGAQAYLPLDHDRHDAIISGRMRV